MYAWVCLPFNWGELTLCLRSNIVTWRVRGREREQRLQAAIELDLTRGANSDVVCACTPRLSECVTNILSIVADL